jgi:large subunit ribosomal protein L22
MQFVAKTKFVWFSPYKLRPLADVIRGKEALYAMQWLSLYKTKRSIPLRKTLKSAIANAYDIQGINMQELLVKEIRVDQGPIRYYFKPGAMGRAMHQRSRQSHITVVVAPKKIKGA